MIERLLSSPANPIHRKPDGAVLDLDSDPRLAGYMRLAEWRVRMVSTRPNDDDPYVAEVRVDDVVIGTSLPAYAFPGEKERLFVFDPPVEFGAQRVFGITYCRLQPDGTQSRLRIEEVWWDENG